MAYNCGTPYDGPAATADSSVQVRGQRVHFTGREGLQSGEDRGLHRGHSNNGAQEAVSDTELRNTELRSTELRPSELRTTTTAPPSSPGSGASSITTGSVGTFSGGLGVSVGGGSSTDCDMLRVEADKVSISYRASSQRCHVAPVTSSQLITTSLSGSITESPSHILDMTSSQRLSPPCKHRVSQMKNRFAGSNRGHRKGQRVTSSDRIRFGILGLNVLIIVTGILLMSFGANINSYVSSHDHVVLTGTSVPRHPGASGHAHRDHDLGTSQPSGDKEPAQLWWFGVMPIILGIIGVICVLSDNRAMTISWMVLTIISVFSVYSVLVILGGLDSHRYGVNGRIFTESCKMQGYMCSCNWNVPPESKHELSCHVVRYATTVFLVLVGVHLVFCVSVTCSLVLTGVAYACLDKCMVSKVRIIYTEPSNVGHRIAGCKRKRSDYYFRKYFAHNI